MPRQSTDDEIQHPPGTGGGTADAPSTEPKPNRVPEAEPVVCPFCGESRPGGGPERCGACGAFTDPLSRQATQNEMGPWFIRDPGHPFRPGCRLETIERWVRTGKVTEGTVLRGPSTHQNWTRADRTPGIARLLGLCHACHGRVTNDEVICRSCGTGLTAERDRQHLGLAAIRAIPGRARPDEIARELIGPASPTSHKAGMRPPAQPSPVRPSAPVSPAHQAPPIAAPSSRAERQLRAARARARAAVLVAALFAALFLLSMFTGWLGRGDTPGENQNGDLQGATPGLADDLMD